MRAGIRFARARTSQARSLSRMATYAIGDVQGCYGSLVRLLDAIEFDHHDDRLWFVGDLVNRGPESLEVLRFVRSLGERAVVVLGNHDLHLVALAAGYGRRRADDTLEAVLAAPDAAELIGWLRRRPLMHLEPPYAMVHAGLLPQWTVQRARELAAEVESALHEPYYRDFLAMLYGSKPDRWEDGLLGFDRLRVIVNAMTRMRFCSAKGVMDFRTKGEPDEAPEGFHPWFEVPGRASRDTAIVCGHWSALGLRITRNLLALDTGCVWRGKLTAVRLEDREVFQVRCPRAQDPALAR